MGIFDSVVDKTRQAIETAEKKTMGRSDPPGSRRKNG